jgi:hypothetical protein
VQTNLATLVLEAANGLVVDVISFGHEIPRRSVAVGALVVA